MATTSNLSSIIRYYAEKQKSPFIDFREFCLYIKKYAEHHLEEQGDLVKYLGDPSGTVTAEIQGLAEKHLVTLTTINDKKIIVAITYMSIVYANRFKQMLTDISVPYPTVVDAPKNFPVANLQKYPANDYIPAIIKEHNPKSPLLYVIEFSKELPSMILPACIPIHVIMETTQQKIRKILSKEEFHDYYLKKLRTVNQNKDLAIQNFFQHYITNPEKNFKDVSDGDEYYLWSQLCYFIRQDFEKIQDKTIDDINILQAIHLSEIYNSYLKQKFQDEHKREEAINALKTALAQSPFYFTMQQILKFQDQNGQLLYGQYTQEDLQNTIQKLSTEGDENQLPPLLIFKTDTSRYYIYKKKVPAVVIRLCNEAHDSIEDLLYKEWYSSLLDYTKLPEMTDQSAFENRLEMLVKDKSPVLYGLLNSNFMSLLPYEKDLEEDKDNPNFQIFSDGRLIPYSELLMLKNSQILSKAKSKLPFIYTIPIISWIISLFNKGKKKKPEKTKKVTTKTAEEFLEDTNDEEFNPAEEETRRNSKPVSKQAAMANQAQLIAKELVPEGSSIDRELNYLCKEWNMLLTKDANLQLTEDVNCLIRDYTRKVVRSLSASSFTRDRLHNLALTLVRTPSMQKIKNQKDLTSYVELYMLRLVSN